MIDAIVAFSYRSFIGLTYLLWSLRAGIGDLGGKLWSHINGGTGKFLLGNFPSSVEGVGTFNNQKLPYNWKSVAGYQFQIQPKDTSYQDGSIELGLATKNRRWNFDNGMQGGSIVTTIIIVNNEYYGISSRACGLKYYRENNVEYEDEWTKAMSSFMYTHSVQKCKPYILTPKDETWNNRSQTLFMESLTKQAVEIWEDEWPFTLSTQHWVENAEIISEEVAANAGLFYSYGNNREAYNPSFNNVFDHQVIARGLTRIRKEFPVVLYKNDENKTSRYNLDESNKDPNGDWVFFDNALIFQPGGGAWSSLGCGNLHLMMIRMIQISFSFSQHKNLNIMA